jgi:hypothetical protein
MNNDGLPDLISAGTTSGFSEENFTGIFQNTGNEAFVEIPHEVPLLAQCYVEWIDVDKDGWQDIYYQGITSDKEFDLGIFKNPGNGTFQETEINIEKISGPRGNLTRNQAVWADFDNDGLPDVSISMSSQEEFKFLFYKNLGDFTFELIDIGLPQLNYVRQAAGDVNQDGLMDLVFAGSDKLTLYSPDMTADVYVFINKGDLVFEEASKVNGIGVFWNTMVLGDFTNDGWMDLMVYGTGSNLKELRLFDNEHDNSFGGFPHAITGAMEGAACFLDFDNDNDLDILQSGRFTYPNDYEATYIFENMDTASNQKPQAPDTLDVFAVNNNVMLSWSIGSDDLTAPGSLYYNLRFGTETYPFALISPFSTDGKLKVNNLGNCNLNRDYYYQNLPEGSYQFNVQAIDHSYNASQFSEAFIFCFKQTEHLFPDTVFACDGNSVTLELSGNYQAYRWNTGSTEATINVTSNGFYNVNLTHFDGCISSETTFVYFYPTPVVNLGPDNILCRNENMILDAGNPGCTYLWSNGSSAGTLLINGSELEPGIYDFSVEVLNEYGCVGTDTISIEVVSIPNVDLGADTSIYLNDTLVLFAGDQGTAYLWSDGSIADSLAIYGNQQEPGVYEYWVRVTNENNCTNSDTIAVNFMGDAAVEEVYGTSKFTLSPNPASENVFINFTGIHPSRIEIRVFNVTGKFVKRKSIHPGLDNSIDISNLKPGLYFFRLTSENKTMIRKLLVR